LRYSTLSRRLKTSSVGPIDKDMDAPASARLKWLMRTAALLWLLVGSLLSPAVPAQSRSDREVKVAFVFNLTKYVEWPHPGGELVVGFLGDDPAMGQLLSRMLNGKISENRPIRVVLSPSDEALARCDLLYIGYASPKKIRAVLEKTRKASILTVGDAEVFARAGGMIGLVTAHEHVQIEVNLEAAQASKLKVSSRLLSLASVVRAAPEARD